MDWIKESQQISKVFSVEDYGILLQRSIFFYQQVDDRPFTPAKNECLKSRALLMKLTAHSLGLNDKNLQDKDE